MILWTFGDSFSCSFSSDYIFTNRYTEFKGYVPKIYSEILSEKFDCKLMNFAKSADSNYGIFSAFISQVENIKPEDIVILQFSSVYRYQLVNKEGNFQSIAAHWDDKYKDFNESPESIKEIGFNRLNKRYYEEIEQWIKIVKLILKKNKLIFWSPFEESTGNVDMLPFYDFTNITVETNNMINDLHYGEDGHKELANYILNVIENKKSLI